MNKEDINPRWHRMVQGLIQIAEGFGSPPIPWLVDAYVEL